MVRFRVLGPVDVFVDGAPVRLRPQERRLLALLLCRPNRPVPTEDLVDELWNGSPPATARTAIRVHVERTRAAMRGHGLSRLTSSEGGYRLVVEPGELDVEIVETALRRAGGASRLPATVRAPMLAEALGLWVGRPFADVDGIPAVDAERERIAARKEEIVADLAQAQLVAGLHDLVRAHGPSWVHEFPFSEPVACAVALARYRCADQPGALSLLRDLRQRLVDELGLDGTPAVGALERAILNHDPALATPDPPTQTPVPVLAGRQDQVDAVLSLVHGGAVPAPVVVVSGPRGIGKTELVRHLHALVPSVMLAARHRTPATVSTLEEALGVDGPAAAGAGVVGALSAAAQRATRLAEAAARAGVTVIVDGPEWLGPDDTAVLEHLLAARVRSPVVLACSSPSRLPAGLAEEVARSATVIALAELTEDGSRDVLSVVLPRQLAEDADLVDQLVERSGGHPFLLVAGARHVAAGNHPQTPPASVTAHFVALVDALSDRQRRLLEVAALDPVAAFDLPLVAELVGLGRADLDDELGELVAAGLVVDSSLGPAFRHDLVRDAVLGTLEEKDRQDLHDRAATALLRRGTPETARLARHLRDAGGARRSEAAVFTASEAGEALLLGGHLRAAELFERAAVLGEGDIGLARDRVVWRLEAGRARTLAGDLEAAQALATPIAHVARALADPTLLSRAAILATGPWRPFGAEQDRAARLTLEAAETPPAQLGDRVALLESLVRATMGRVDARLDAALAEAASQFVTALDGPVSETRMLALRGLHSLTWRADTGPVERLRLSGQMVDLARRLHEPELTLTALWTHTKDALDSGDLALFAQALAEYRRDAVASGFALHQWWSATIGATEATLFRDDAALRAADAAAERSAAYVDQSLLVMTAVERAFATVLATDLASAPQLLEHAAPDVAQQPVVQLGLMAIDGPVAPASAGRVEYLWQSTAGTPHRIAGACFALSALRRVARDADRDRLVAELRSFCGPYSGALVTVNGGAVFGLVDDLLALSCAMMGDVTGEQRHARSAARVRRTAQVPTALSERI
ncbi:MAG TPA: BTAD domain-containing putative transcriptional regulator [Ornithinibacter sp.]|uniref:BTAD domain-containing putative transcriptional regulator n=1 Tax=Ornithinibacter sp. TaxID=2862748 RepID=UPI001B5B9458|nr:BTAD domain-containing putative transcriptional regulator [Ornithinibacter sp.]MBP6523910.1 winged helix-turn-helix domain-containing protein [Dermatophilaceae bacterium]HNV42048.1 BTAD domain-containing putative transcriptional regulator [Ornithinibacter sp.]HQV83387.1 BTAD domain-containing putative transcriptional regulator [Ornithinibacter sp.]HQW74654.1 BTAD domain-containing putative transcriptional regulator [Ornithinibacter sp.]HQX87444.1 BTAD domain-containing putative transcriptio